MKRGANAKLGRRKEVRYIDDAKKAKALPLTGLTTQYVIPDGWLYPLVGSFRMLLDWPSAGRGKVSWMTDPFKYFDTYGLELIEAIIDQSGELGNNPNAVGKSKRVWSGLRMMVENRMLKEKAAVTG